ncbi:hypothetical protein BJY52DRAFT_1268566 [Lactarius psammicola]|nr:hypothetical protein BJY52DRAFT_1268566 [Lactarius psammicola]
MPRQTCLLRDGVLTVFVPLLCHGNRLSRWSRTRQPRAPRALHADVVTCSRCVRFLPACSALVSVPPYPSPTARPPSRGRAQGNYSSL